MSARTLTALSQSRSAILGCRRYHKYIFFTASPGATGPGSARPVPTGRAARRAADSRDRRPRGGVRAPPPPRSPPRSAKSRHNRRARDCLPLLFISFSFSPSFPSCLPLSPAREPEAGERPRRPAPSARAPAPRSRGRYMPPAPPRFRGFGFPGQTGVRARRGRAGKYFLPLHFFFPQALLSL